MFGMKLVCAGRASSFEDVLARALESMHVRIVARTETTWHGRYDWARSTARPGEIERETIAFCGASAAFSSGAMADFVDVDVRGPRRPEHTLLLAQRLSKAVGGLAAAMIVDRLTDHYGLGAFFAGVPLEHWTADITSHERHAEDRCGEWWRATARAMGVEYANRDEQHVVAFAIEPVGPPPSLDPPPAFSGLAIAGPRDELDRLGERAARDGWGARFELLRPTYEVGDDPTDLVDAVERPVLLLAKHELVARWPETTSPCARMSLGSPQPVADVLRAWDAIKRATRHHALHFAFG